MSNKFKDLDQSVQKAIKSALKKLEKSRIKLYKNITSTVAEEKISLYDKNKLKKLENIENKIKNIIIKDEQIVAKDIKLLLKEIANITLKGTLKDIEHSQNALAIQKKISTEEIINDTVGGRQWRERTKHMAGNTAYDIITEVRKGTERGDSYETTAKAIAKKMGKYIGQPLTIAKTESHRITETIKYKAMTEVAKEIKIFKIWHSVGDERVRDSHVHMDGQKVPIDEEFTLPSGAKAMYPGESGVAAEDINCRCFVEYIEEKAPTENTEKEPETLENTEEKGYNKDKENTEIEKPKEITKIETPKTLNAYPKHAETWYNKVVLKKINEDEAKEIGNYMKKMIDDHEFTMRRKPHTFDKIVQDGRFKTLFETNTSGGLPNTEVRIKGANQLFGGRQRSTKPEDREKYGYLSYKNFMEDITNTGATQYGKCIIHFKKENLIERTTYTVGDSLGMGLNKVSISGRTNSPDANGIYLADTKGLMESVRNNYNLKDFLEERRTRYLELQYHGELTIDDISEVCYQEGQPSDSTMKILKEKGIKIFKFKDGEIIEI